MLTFVFRKMLNKKWMALSLLIGNILLISITTCNPLYMDAVLQRTLTRNLSDAMQTKNTYPGVISLSGAFISRGTTLTNFEKFKLVDELAASLPERFAVPARYNLTHFYLTNVKAYPVVARGDDKDRKSIEVGFLTDLEEHISLIAGDMFTSEPDENGVYDVLVSHGMMVRQDVLLGEEYRLTDFTDKNGDVLTIRIAGVFENSAADDVYWVKTPTSYTKQVFMPEGLFRELFVDYDNPIVSLNADWYTLLDYEAMRGDTVEDYLATVAAVEAEITSSKDGFRYADNFSAIFEDYLVKAAKVRVTLWVLQAPVYVLLGAFIFMVTRQMLEMEQNEIAILKSRGAGKRQILTVYILQSVILSLLALGVGLPLGGYLCQVLGSSNAFLEFVKRKSLTIEYNQTVLLFALGATLFSVLVMVLPVIRFSNVTIVAHKQRKNRKSGSAWWQKSFLDVAILGVALYGLFSFNNQREILAARVADGASLDPLLFVSSSLFIIGAALVALRLVPLVVWLVFTIGKKFWSPALYASFLRVLRTRSNQGFIMVFLMLTIALGIFNAQTARTINTNEEDRLKYETGADIVLQEVWQDNSAMVEDSEDIEYYEPDFARYANLEGVKQISKVLYSSSVETRVGSGKDSGVLSNVKLLGINTKEFGQLAWFKDGLLPTHWYNYLNAISQNSRAILVSSNFKKYGLEIGDMLYYQRKGVGDAVRGVIYGFFDYFPTYKPVVRERGADGLYTEKDNFLIVAHLNQLQASWGVTPYQIWIDAEDSTQFVYDFAEQNGLTYQTFTDRSKELVSMKNDPIFQGTNGILTVSFIVVLLLCTTGFLIYWILSIQSRSLQFGIFRAMGMSVREILTMLINEQIFISGLSIAIGAVIGELASKLYIPLIQIAYAAAEQSLPLAIVREATDDARLFAVIGGMMFACMVILGVLISKIKISQALKLGED